MNHPTFTYGQTNQSLVYDYLNSWFLDPAWMTHVLNRAKKEQTVAATHSENTQMPAQKNMSTFTGTNIDNVPVCIIYTYLHTLHTQHMYYIHVCILVI